MTSNGDNQARRRTITNSGNSSNNRDKTEIYIKQSKPIRYETQQYDKQQLQQTLQAIQTMKQQITQRIPNNELSNPKLEQLGAKCQTNIQLKV